MPKVYVSDEWISNELKRIGISQSVLLDGSRIRKRKDTIVIDLEKFSYSNLFNILNMFLVIGIAKSIYQNVVVKLPILSDGRIDALPPEEYRHLRIKNNYYMATDDRKALYDNVKDGYKFISYLNFNNFFDSILEIGDRNIEIQGYNSSIKKHLKDYSGITTYGTRVFPLVSIDTDYEVNLLRTKNNITNWIEGLPEEFRKSPVIMDGEFAYVFGYQLVKNIIEHSGNRFQGGNRSTGGLAMRILPPTAEHWIKGSYPAALLKIYDNIECSGILEVCVGDIGVGISSTILDAYTSFLESHGIQKEFDESDLIAFCFDQIGSSKPVTKRWGGVHALNRILKCVSKYNGIIKIRSSGCEMIYDSVKKRCYKECRGIENPVGVYPYKYNIREMLHPIGTQLQLLIPLIEKKKTIRPYKVYRPEKAPKTLASRKTKIISLYPLIKNVPTPIYDENNLIDQLKNLANSLIEGHKDRIIVLDFSNLTCTEEEFAFIFWALKVVIHNRLCIGFGIDMNIANSLIDRDRYVVEIECKEDNKYFFTGLSPKHKLLPILDNNDTVWWFGLGRYDDLESALDLLIDSHSPIPLNDLHERIYKNDQTKKSMLAIYLENNPNYFYPVVDKGHYNWMSHIKKNDIYNIINIAITKKIDESFKRSGSILSDNKLYKLPSSSKFTDLFVQTSSVMQDELYSSQITNWMASAIRRMYPSKLYNEKKELLVVCVTAPSELLARNICAELRDFRTHILNLGYYSAIDEEKIFKKNDWDMPAIIVSDIVDKERTIEQLFRFIGEVEIGLIGLVALVKFEKEGDYGYIQPYLETFDEINKFDKIKYQNFFVSRMKRPKTYTEEEAKNLKDEDDIYFIEPYSLEQFKYSSLRQQRESKGLTKWESINTERIKELGKIGAFKYGHWVFGEHHFKITTALETIFSNQPLRGSIISEIVQICKQAKINHILVPLHSNIGSLVPKLISAINFLLGYEIDYTYCISTKTLSKNFFYVLPKRINRIIYDIGYSLRNNRQQSNNRLRALIIDDAIASGRTIETLVRAIIRSARINMTEFECPVSPVEGIYAYTVIDRQGKARDTFWTGINMLNLEGDGEWEKIGGDTTVQFKFERWVTLDMPVHSRKDCSICTELKELNLIRNDIIYHKESSILKELISKYETIRPKAINIPDLYSNNITKLDKAYEIGRLATDNFDLYLLEMHNLIHRGYPWSAQIETYDTLLEAYFEIKPNEIEQEWHPTLEEINLENIIIIISKTLIQNWNLICSQWAEKKLCEKLQKLFSKSSVTIKRLLPEFAFAIINSNSESKSKHLIDLFYDQCDWLKNYNSDTTYAEKAMLNLSDGIMIFIIYFQHHYNQYGVDVCDGNHMEPRKFYHGIGLKLRLLIEADGINSLNKKYLNRIFYLYQNVKNPHKLFLPNLHFLINHTVRPARNSAHPYLIPSRIFKLVRNQKLGKNERDILIEDLRMLMHSIEIVTSNSENMLVNSKIRNSIESLNYYINETIECLKKDLPITDFRARTAYSMLYNFYPDKSGDALFERLSTFNISIKAIIEWIESECSKNEIKFSKTGLEEIELYSTILAPDPIKVKSMIENILFSEFKKVNVSDKNVYMKYNIEKNADGLPLIAFYIYTDYKKSDSDKNFYDIGSGVKELHGIDFRLFEISAHGKVINQEIEGVQYDFETIIKFCAGIPVKKEVAA